jgi:hypothetical protein
LELLFVFPASAVSANSHLHLAAYVDNLRRHCSATGKSRCLILLHE